MPGCLNNKSIITRELECGNTFITICAAGFGGGMEIYMKKKFLLLLCTAAAVGLCACASNSASKEPAALESTKTPETTAEVSETSASGDAAEVTFWHSFSGATGEAFQSIIDTYNQTRGAEKGIKVNAVFQGYEGTDKVILAYQTKDTVNAPDINVGLTSTIPSLMDMDWTVPADIYLNRAGAEVTQDTFYAPMLRSCTYQDSVVSVPFANSIPLLYYNADALKEAGFTEPPKTLDELTAYTEKLMKKDSSGAVTRYGLNLQVKRYPLVDFIGIQNPDFFFGDNEGGRKAPMTKITAGEDGSLAAFLEKWETLVETGGYKYTEDKINEEFAQGLSAMVIMSSSRIGTMDSLMDGSFEYKTAFLPKVNEGDTGSAAIGGSCLTLFNRGDQARVDAAWDVISYCVSPESQMVFSQASGYIPVNTETETLPEMVSYYEEHPQAKVALEQLKSANPLCQEPLDLTYNEINALITETMLAFCDGKLTPQQASDKIVDGGNALLDEYHSAND